MMRQLTLHTHIDQTSKTSNDVSCSKFCSRVLIRKKAKFHLLYGDEAKLS